MQSFAYIKERVWSKLQGWKECLLSQAGQEVLLKAMVQAVPPYSMSFFHVPDCLCYDLEGLMRRFWWSHGDDKRKICWVWRLQHEKHSLFYKVFQAKFFLTSTILDAKENSWGSYAWRSILWARKVICSGLWWRIGDGSQVKIWGDKWLTDPHLPKLISPCPTQLVDCNVSRIIDSITKSWNIDEIKSFLLPFEAKAIQCIPLSFQGARDTMIWYASQDGAFSVRSAY
uniref:Reverse transcriptase zinc-binding domain-containing protein n=1 Tax=Fagus sylvatica TaxID=28930 RepID=A0A2N9FDG6_FAGSY